MNSNIGNLCILIIIKQLGLIALVFCITIAIIGYFVFSQIPPADPDIDRIAFIAKTVSPALFLDIFSREDIYITNVEGQGLTHLKQQPELGWGLTWSPQGDKVAYYEYETEGLYLVNSDGSGQPELIWQGFQVLDPAWSPDGKYIAFTDDALYLLSLKTGDVEQLVNDFELVMHPGWSPDSKQIAFTFIGSSDSKRRPDSAIGIINMDGSDFSQITPNDKSRYPHWSPDGKQILFNREGNIYLMSITGTDVKALTQDGKSHQPTWSPDGSRIAFVSTENQRCGPTIADSMPFCTSELRVMDADGSNVILLRGMRNTEISWPVWGPLN